MKGCWLIRQLLQQLPDSLRAWYVSEQWKLVSCHAATRVSVWHVLEDFSPSLVQFVVAPWITCTEYIFPSVPCAASLLFGSTCSGRIVKALKKEKMKLRRAKAEVYTDKCAAVLCTQAVTVTWLPGGRRVSFVCFANV